MAGDVDNPRIWQTGDTMSAPLGSSIPTNVEDAWPAEWDVLGILGEDGMTETRSEDETEHWGWGSILYRVTRTKHKRTFTVGALEDNAVLWAIANPGSTVETAGGVTTRTYKVPNSDVRMFGFELTDGDITKRIVIERGEAKVSADKKYSDGETTSTEVTITVYPNADRELFIEITDDPQAEDVGGS